MLHTIGMMAVNIHVMRLTLNAPMQRNLIGVSLNGWTKNTGSIASKAPRLA
jgi:hypothetical protein